MKKLILAGSLAAVLMASGAQAIVDTKAVTNIQAEVYGTTDTLKTDTSVNGSVDAAVGASSNVAPLTSDTSADIEIGASGKTWDRATFKNNTSLESQSSISSSSEVQDSASLDAYIGTLFATDANLEEITSNENEVTVEYKVPARILGFIKTNMDIEVTVDANGNATIDYPWYHFMTDIDKAELKTMVEANVDAALTQTQSVTLSESAGANANVSAQSKAAIIEAVQSALAANFDAAVSAENSAVLR